MVNVSAFYFFLLFLLAVFSFLFVCSLLHSPQAVWQPVCVCFKRKRSPQWTCLVHLFLGFTTKPWGDTLAFPCWAPTDIRVLFGGRRQFSHLSHSHAPCSFGKSDSPDVCVWVCVWVGGCSYTYLRVTNLYLLCWVVQWKLSVRNNHPSLTSLKYGDEAKLSRCNEVCVIKCLYLSVARNTWLCGPLCRRGLFFIV